MQNNTHKKITLLYNDKLILSIMAFLIAVPISIFYYSISDIPTMIFIGSIDIAAITLVVYFGITTPYFRKVGSIVLTEENTKTSIITKTIILGDGTTVTQYFDMKSGEGIQYNDKLDTK